MNPNRVLSASGVPGMIRDNPLGITVNGLTAYFPYSLDGDGAGFETKKVLCQKYFIEAARNSYYEGHVVVTGPKGKPINRFRPIRP